MLSAVALSKSYGGILAVKDLAFTAVPGQVVGLLGPNGSGKSTTINMLTGLLQPTRGQVTWRGRNIHHDLIGYQSVLGYVPEEPRLYGYLTAPEYLVARRRAAEPARADGRAIAPIAISSCSGWSRIATRRWRRSRRACGRRC